MPLNTPLRITSEPANGSLFYSYSSSTGSLMGN